MQRTPQPDYERIVLGMNVPEHFSHPFLDEANHTLRPFHYPFLRREIFQNNPGQVRADEHSDSDSITLLFQGRNGGLQVRTPQGTFADAIPIVDTVVVNAGDLLALVQ